VIRKIIRLPQGKDVTRAAARLEFSLGK
jgi:hypothetical protein